MKRDRKTLIVLVLAAVIVILGAILYVFFIRGQAPAQITGLKATDAHDGKIDLTWDPSTELDFDHYVIYRDAVRIAVYPMNSYQDTGLTNGQSYAYQVSAVNIDGEEGRKSEVSIGIPTDVTPPLISNLQPTDNAVIYEYTPIISADYSDPSGVDTTSVSITVDNVDVTTLATITSASMSFTPTEAFAEGQHTIEVKVSDTFGNEAIQPWSFAIKIEKWALLIGSVNNFPPRTTTDLVKKYLDVPNPSFEDPFPDCWDFFGPVYGNKPAHGAWDLLSHTGDYSVSVHCVNPGEEGYWGLWSWCRPLVTPGVQYTVSVWIKTFQAIDSAYIGIAWYNAGGNFIGVSRSPGITGTFDWTLKTWTATAPATAASVDIWLMNDLWVNGVSSAWFDDVEMWYSYYDENQWELQDRDGFPGQVLQAYDVLKAHGYPDDHTMLMLYHDDGPGLSGCEPYEDDDGIDEFIDYNGDGNNDLTQAVINVENTAVTKDRLRTEIQNLAAKVDENDEVLIYFVGHGSRAGTTAYLHFETSDKASEQEIAQWLNTITCQRMTVLVDSCYSGNFVSSLSANNRILVSASADKTAKYWAQAGQVADAGYAGSWFFYPFWERINAGDSIWAAYDHACNTVPALCGPYAGQKVKQIQDPQLVDGMGDASTYSPF